MVFVNCFTFFFDVFAGNPEALRAPAFRGSSITAVDPSELPAIPGEPEAHDKVDSNGNIDGSCIPIPKLGIANPETADVIRVEELTGVAFKFSWTE